MADITGKEFFFKVELMVAQNPNIVVHVVERLNHGVGVKVVKQIGTVILHCIADVD